MACFVAVVCACVLLLLRIEFVCLFVGYWEMMYVVCVLVCVYKCVCVLCCDLWFDAV